jgi:zinc/manganese transport system permease protein
MILGLGSLFLSMTTEYAPQIYSLLFGQVLGVNSSELLPTAVIAALCITAILVLYQPLLWSSVLPEAAEARGVRRTRMELAFLLVIALASTMAVPVVGTLLVFTLLISPAASARSFTANPLTAMGLSVVFALVTVWSAIALSFATNLPVGFFVGSIGAFLYALGRAWATLTDRRQRPVPTAAPLATPA